MLRIRHLRRPDCVCIGTLAAVALLVAVVPSPGADFTIVRHTISGEFMANVFDGGPPVTLSGSIDNPLSNFMASATDLTRPSSFGAAAIAAGESRVYAEGQQMNVRVDFEAAYYPSLFPEGDRPGGRAEGNLSSIIEFLMPADEIEWAYGLRIRYTTGFSGSTSVVIENVTQSQPLLSLSSEVTWVETSLSGNMGDLIRITSSMSGSGLTPSGIMSGGQYDPTLDMIFLIPEPSTLALLGVGSLVVLRGPRRSDGRRHRRP